MAVKKKTFNGSGGTEMLPIDMSQSKETTGRGVRRQSRRKKSSNQWHPRKENWGNTPKKGGSTIKKPKNQGEGGQRMEGTKSSNSKKSPE